MVRLVLHGRTVSENCREMPLPCQQQQLGRSVQFNLQSSWTLPSTPLLRIGLINCAPLSSNNNSSSSSEVRKGPPVDPSRPAILFSHEFRCLLIMVCPPPRTSTGWTLKDGQGGGWGRRCRRRRCYVEKSIHGGKHLKPIGHRPLVRDHWQRIVI